MGSAPTLGLPPRQQLVILGPVSAASDLKNKNKIWKWPAATRFIRFALALPLDPCLRPAAAAASPSPPPSQTSSPGAGWFCASRQRRRRPRQPGPRAAPRGPEGPRSRGPRGPNLGKEGRWNPNVRTGARRGRMLVPSPVRDHPSSTRSWAGPRLPSGRTGSREGPQRSAVTLIVYYPPPFSLQGILLGSEDNCSKNKSNLFIGAFIKQRPGFSFKLVYFWRKTQ